jgi:predicted ATP-dependent endonuclease of OLD family
MYLKSFSIENFRKFRKDKNEIYFVNAEDYTKEEAISIACKTTLIVGKNNSGKTTVVEALKRLRDDSVKFTATDFNFDYLKELLECYATKGYLNSNKLKEVPSLIFILTIAVDKNEEDLVTNIIPFMNIGDVEKSEVKIIIKWAPKEDEVFIMSVKNLIKNTQRNKANRFDLFLNLINESDYCVSYLNSNNEKRVNFSLKKLIDIETITANNITSNKCLSDAFSKIVDYRYKHMKNNEEEVESTKIDKNILQINKELSEYFKREHSDGINDSLEEVISGEKCKILLKADLSFNTVLRNVLKYEYVEKNNNIPENQFGLGYTKLMMIIADIITYMEKYPEDSFNSQINLISIEEPEAFMHPQMQELFIKNINDMISSLLLGKNKHVNSQIIITTHSPHILNSKIHNGNTFNNINYITEKDSMSQVVSLRDEIVLDVPINDTDEEMQKYNKNLSFLKKHIKFKISEIFFADAIIFVEGITEYILLQYFIDRDESLNKYYISLVLVDGAHAKVYEKLIKTIGIPTLIVTDIDIKREEEEKDTYLQIKKEVLKGRITTNTTLSHFYGTNNLESIVNQDYKVENNLKLVFQKNEINGYYSTSFEEAFILTNSENEILKTTLKSVKPQIYSSVIKDGGLKLNSYKLQRKLKDSKSDFANALLFEILTSDDANDIPVLPQYILDGLDFLREKLGGTHCEL